MRVFIFFLFMCCYCFSANASQEEKCISAAAYGAIPDDGKDDGHHYGDAQALNKGEES